MIRPRLPMRPPTSAPLARAALIAALLAPAAALAQAPAAIPSFELERLPLNPGAETSLLLGTGELLPAGGFRLSVAGHFEQNPLLLYREGTQVGAVVGQRATAHILAAYAFTRWLQVDAQLPVVVFQRGDDLTGSGLAAPGGPGLSTPSLSARLGLLSERGAAPLDLALELGAGLPVGSAASLARDPGVRLSPRVTVGRSLGPVRLGVDASMLVRPAVPLSNDGNVTDEIGNEVNLGVVLATTGKGLRGEVDVLGSVPLTRAPRTLEALAGLRFPLGEVLELYALGGLGIGAAPGTPTWRVLAGVAFGGAPQACAPGGKHKPAECPDLDDDGDGLKNAADACPTEGGKVDARGCPVKDADSDGVMDAEDKCPNEAGPASRQGCPVEDADGDGLEDAVDQCPSAAGPKELQGCPDADGDGVPDSADKCPREAGPANRDGCPLKDTDGDSVLDDKDACPAQAGLAELRGCPAKDTDGDTVADHLDNCPDVKGVPDNQGCPPQQQQMVAIRKTKLELKQKIFFDTNKAKIQPKSFKLMDQVAKVLQEHPEIEKISIEGHTDDRGSAERNRKLSQQRADAVRAYLINKGVNAARLEAKGFGPDRPVQPNTTEKGREANRRVEMVIRYEEEQKQ